MASNSPVVFTEVQRFQPTFNKKFRRLQTKVNYVVTHQLANSVGNLLEISKAIDDEYEKVVQSELNLVPNCAYFSVNVDSEKLKTSIYIPPHRPDNFHKEDFANTIAKVLNSNEEFLLSQKLFVTFTHVLKISGTGRAPSKIGERNSRCGFVHKINNKDNSCLLRAVVLGIYICVHGKDKNWKNYKRPSCKAQVEDAKQLAFVCGLNFFSKLDLSHLKIIDEYFGEKYKLIVVDQANKANRLFVGSNSNRSIYLEFVDHHFNLITNIKHYFSKKHQLCEVCFKTYPYNYIHTCVNSCELCGGEKHDFVLPCITCDDCLREFHGDVCFNNHIVLETCNKKKCCATCFIEYHNVGGNPHTCGEYFCTVCKEQYSEQPHFCFIKTLCKPKLQEEDDKYKPYYLFFDIESVTKEGEDGKKFHQPILLIAQMCCDDCYKKETKSAIDCNFCIAETIFYSEKCIVNFIYFLIDLAKQIDKANGNLIVFAHYGKGYDMQFIFRELILQKYKPEPVCQGLKVLYMKLGNIRFLDSISFLLQSLKALPSTFGFENLVEKGDFPHILNDVNYKGQLPPIETYGTKFMMPKSAAEIEVWHSKNKNKDFDFQRDIKEYCSKDVQVLMLAIMTFKNLFVNITSLNPFTRNFTLASAGFESIRSTFLTDNFMHKTPSNPPEYFHNKRSSKIANIWLDYIDSTKKTKLIREYRIGPFYVDGADPSRKIAYEFSGCYWHHCPCTPLSDPTEFSRSLTRMRKIESIGWEILEMKECVFRTTFEKTPFYQQRFKHYTLLEKYGPCNLSEAFFGGRCTNLSFLRECADDEVVEYFDVVSEYPYCLKYRQLPFGIPKQITDDFDLSLESYGNLGYAKVCILPPNDLLLPVLPSRINKKQVYTLCRTCAELSQQQRCTHKDDEKYLINTYTLCELREALRLNYKIIWITQILTYDESAINPYADYVDLFLKIKQEASGFPDWVKTEDDQDHYVDLYFEKENIKLDKTKIKFNAGLRFIAKIFLNSSWGKLAQRINMTSVEVCLTANEYFYLLNDESKIILGDVEIENDAMLVSWKYRNEDESRTVNTKIAVASHVTSWARLHLFKYIAIVEQNYGKHSLLYMDTDSLIYVRKKEQHPLPTGCYLGDLTNEFPDSRITKFVSTGSKSYGLEYLNSEGEQKSLLKIKGIKLTVAALEIINFKKIIEQSIQYIQNNTIQIEIPQFEIRPTKQHIVYSRIFIKNFKPTSTKRVINSGKTLPYGYID